MKEAQMIPILWSISGLALVVIAVVVRNIAREMRAEREEDEEILRQLEDWRDGK